MTKLLFIIIIIFVGCGDYGCIDEEACNYDPDAMFTDSTSCVYAIDSYDCDGNLIDECGVPAGDDVYLDGFCQDDLDFLIDLVEMNPSLYNEAPLEVGVQNWTNYRLTNFSLQYSGITQIPESVENLTHLTNLQLQYNNIQTLPEELFNLDSLTYLTLHHNEITIIPNNIENLIDLTYLTLGSNQITALPDQIGSLINLQQLSLSYNNLTSLPESIGNLSNLDYLYLEHNQITELPNSLCDLNTVYINLQYNNLCDEYDYNYCTYILFGYEDQSNCCDGDNGIPNWTQCDD